MKKFNPRFKLGDARVIYRTTTYNSDIKLIRNRPDVFTVNGKVSAFSAKSFYLRSEWKTY